MIYKFRRLLARWVGPKEFRYYQVDWYIDMQGSLRYAVHDLNYCINAQDKRLLETKRAAAAAQAVPA